MTLWTYEHAITLLPAMAVMALLSLLLRHFLKDQPRKVRMIPVIIITAVLLLLEVGKQVLSFVQGYDLYHIPLHFCSLFLFVMPCMCFYSGKHSHKVDTVAASLCGSVFLMMAVYPVLIYGDFNVRAFFTDFFSFHTVVFHNLVVLLFFLILSLELYTPQKGDWKVLIWFMVGYGVIAATVAQVLRTNYNNFYQCNIPPLESLRQLVQSGLGYWPSQILYVVIVIAMDVGFVLMVRMLMGLTKRKAAV